MGQKLNKYPPHSVAMVKGHLDQARKNQHSTKPLPTPSSKKIVTFAPLPSTRSGVTFANSTGASGKRHRRLRH
jgi:hypothetical protein